jgi:hypothetical protein
MGLTRQSVQAVNRLVADGLIEAQEKPGICVA